MEKEQNKKSNSPNPKGINSYKDYHEKSELKLIHENKNVTLISKMKNLSSKIILKTNLNFYQKRNIVNKNLSNKSSAKTLFPVIKGKKSLYMNSKLAINNSVNKTNPLKNNISYKQTIINKDIKNNYSRQLILYNFKKNYRFIQSRYDNEQKTNNYSNINDKVERYDLSPIKNNKSIISNLYLDRDNFRRTTRVRSKMSNSCEKANISSLKRNESSRMCLFDNKKVKLKYCVFPGNNTRLIDQVMDVRKDVWEKADISQYRFCDLIWSPLTSSIDFKNGQFCQMRLYANLLKHCEKKNIDISKIFPFTICLILSHHTFEEQLNNFKNIYKNIDDYTPTSNVTFASLFNILLYRKIGSIQTINIPKTFNSGKNIWIIKPVNLNRGRCIKVLSDVNEIYQQLKTIQLRKKIPVNDSKSNLGVKCSSLLLQKYLEKPLLYQGRKFGIRIWVMLISNRDNEIFIFREGHLKATSLKYDLNSKDIFVHLTNYSVQKHNQYFSRSEIGNEIPFSEFQNELNKKRSGVDFRRDIYPQIVKIIRLTGGAGYGKVNFLKLKNCFEIFGYDFILDEKYVPYLLEINSNPGLEFSSPLIRQLLPRMIDDAFKLTIDDEFPTTSSYVHQLSKFPVDNQTNTENLWERYTIL